jgi:hypothetical protein
VTRRRRAAIGATAVALILVGLYVGLAPGDQTSHGPPAGAFAWLRPGPPPADWSVARIRGGATVSYPPGWRPLKTDPGTATAGLLKGGDGIVGYLNATPRQGQETLENWGSFRPDHNRDEGIFRPDHNRDEGDRSVDLIASSTGLPFRGGHGSCVIDDYTTSRATYREIACLASGARSSAVVVAAAPTSGWRQEEATLRRAVSAFVP